MKYLYLLLFYSITVIGISAQSKQDYVWLFGVDEETFPLETGYMFNFNKPPLEVKEHDNNIGIGKANTSICDEEGDLLMYMNGCAVMNRNFEMMPNGDSLSYNILWDLANHNCNIGTIGSFQDHLILPDPGKENEFYVIHKPRLYNGNGLQDSIPLWYSKVDLELEEGLGDLLLKNQVLDNSRQFLLNYLTAISHENGVDWWIIQALVDDSLFHTFLIDDDGAKLSHIQNSHHFFTTNHTSASGTAKFSPDGTRYAMYNEVDGLLIYDFDRGSGQLTFRERITPYVHTGESVFCSVEWSPNSRFIYTASSIFLHQIDLWEENIQENGVRLIDTYNGTQDPFSTNFFMMAQAPDCKIYMAPQSGTRSYHVIHKPDELGSDCNFVQNGLKLPQLSNFGGMPNFPRFRVDEEEKCNPLLTSIFGNTVFYRRELKIYPSPSDGKYTIEMPDGFSEGMMSILNMDGQIIRQQEVSNKELLREVDISSFPLGLYQIELFPKENKERIFWGMQVSKI